MSHDHRSDTGLRAVTVALPEAPDLLAEAGDTGYLWRDEGGGFAGRGVAARLRLPRGLSDRESVQQIGAVLAAIETDNQVGGPGTGPVALGALAFDPTAAGELVVPRRLVGRRGDQAWLTVIEGGDDRASQDHPASRSEVGEAASGRLAPDEFRLASSMPQSEWQQVVADAVAVIQGGELDKVVLARRVDISANRPFVVSDVIERLIALYPTCMVYSIDGFIGASPELLLRRTADRIESHPLAGTVARSGDAHGDEALVAGLMASGKARHEHQVVVDAIVAALGPECSEITVPDRPSILGLRNVSHLATFISARSKARDGAHRTALELVARLHPTPAVGGTPTDAAIRYLQKVEGFDRGCYAGPVGWVDASGDGAWAVGIRCAEIDGSQARIFAGNGIVAGSVPRDELAETQLKLQALLAALVRP
jgi:menaquinone-specific isochorismate synthase